MANGPGQITEARSAAGVDGGTMTLTAELVYPGKGAKLYGPYWYASQRVGHRLHRVYVGRRLSLAKARERLQRKIRAARPC